MREALWLVRNGVSLDVALSIDDVTRTAWAIVFSEMEGHKFNFNTMCFEQSQ